MERTSPLREPIAAQAADWFARLQAPEQKPGDREEFTEWLLRSPTHIEEFLTVTRVWGDLRLASGDELATDRLIRTALEEVGPANVVPLSRIENVTERRDMGAQREPKRRRATWRAIAAVAVLAVAGLAWFGATSIFGPPHIRTAIGEQRTMTLEDGSIVHVNTDSELAIDLDLNERRIDLIRSEAHFEVAKDHTRPFVVTTPQAIVRALGTIFNVQAAQKRTAVAVLEGHVEVVSHLGAVAESAEPAEEKESQGGDAHDASIRTLSPSMPSRTMQSTPSRIQLRAGEQAAVTPDGEILPSAGPPIEQVLGWTERRLVFREQTLGSVVTEFNRYHTRPLRIADPSLAEHRISGTFATHDVASLLQFLQRYQDVQIEDTPDGSRVLTRRATSVHATP